MVRRVPVLRGHTRTNRNHLSVIGPDFVFAYGSLIAVDAGFLAPGRDVWPVTAHGLRRGWYLPIPEDRNTGLGAIYARDGLCNGLLIEQSAAGLKEADDRERKHGYDRVALPARMLSPGGGSSVPQGRIWVYVTDHPVYPTVELPIAQSYLDVVLSGCLDIGLEFATQFIRTTDGWEYPWVDDRQNPRYRRARPPDADLDAAVDGVLESAIPRMLAKRRSG